MFSLFYSLLNRLQISYIFPQLGKTERCYPKGQRCCRVRKAHVYSQRPAWWTPTFGEMFFTRTLPAITRSQGTLLEEALGNGRGAGGDPPAHRGESHRSGCRVPHETRESSPQGPRIRRKPHVTASGTRKPPFSPLGCSRYEKIHFLFWGKNPLCVLLTVRPKWPGRAIGPSLWKAFKHRPSLLSRPGVDALLLAASKGNEERGTPPCSMAPGSLRWPRGGEGQGQVTRLRQVHQLPPTEQTRLARCARELRWRKWELLYNGY